MLRFKSCKCHLSVLLFILSMLMSLTIGKGTVAAQTEAADTLNSLDIRTRYIGDHSIEQVTAGEPGSGTLLLMRADDSLRPALMVRFSRPDTASPARAEVYDTPTGLDYLPLRILGNEVEYDSRYLPTLVFTAPDGWWVRNGKVNYNLTIEVRGPIYAMWGSGYNKQSGPTGWTTLMRRGEPAVRINVHDEDNDGFPDWDLRTMIPSFPGRGYLRTNYAERRCSTPHTFEPGVVPQWPFVALDGGFEQPVGQLRAPIVVDWDQGKITHFSELVTVRSQNCAYAIYAINPLALNELNTLSFETPFAFYDLSGQGRGYPNLILRTERYPANDPWSTGIEPAIQRGRPLPRDYQTIRYSWRNQVGDGNWDYKLEVLGSYQYTDQTSIAGGLAKVDAPPYDSFPSWVVERPWPVAVFVDTEQQSYRSSEGIYDWSPRALGLAYVVGWDDKPSDAPFTNVAKSLRGEYRTTREAALQLYFSPIDNRLHLLGAEGGFWKLSDTELLRVHNLDQGDHINGWTRERHIEQQPAIILEALYALPHHFLYSGQDTVELRRADYEPASLVTLPPSDAASWRTFIAQIVPLTDQRRDPEQMRSWPEAFSGTTSTIHGVALRNVRHIDDGFRFVLELQPDFRVSGPDLLKIGKLEAGRYVVTYDGDYEITPLTPPQIELSMSEADSESSLVRGIPGELTFTLRNVGTQDVETLKVMAVAIGPQNQQIEIGEQTAPALSGKPEKVAFTWSPPVPGTWALQIVVATTSGEPVTTIDRQATVVEPPKIPLAQLATAFGLTPIWLVALSLLFVLGLSAAVASMLTMRDIE